MNLNRVQTFKVFILLLSYGYEKNNGENINHIAFNNVSRAKWHGIYKLATQQGLTVFLWETIIKFCETCKISVDQMPDKALKIQWALSAERIKSRYNKQRQLAMELADAYAKRGINTYVLKGPAISGYYPTPMLRECGDLDCFLAAADDNGMFECRYEEGNKIAEEIGAKVDRDFYKHSHINYKGLMVENHAFCTAVRGSKERKEFEKHLRKLLSSQPSTPIDGTTLLRPCADFNALFLTAHSFSHFLTEGIKLRHVLDWAYLLKAEQDNIDWKSFYAWCDKMHYTKFVDALTAISTEYLGLEVSNPLIHTHSDLRDKVLEDILYGERSIHNTGASKFKKRLMIVRNKLFGGWKYRELYEKSAVVDTMQMVLAFLIERKPRI